MKDKFICDMTKGNETGLLIRFTLPLLLGNLFQQLYNIVDSAIVGRYVGPDALGAVGSVGTIHFLFFSLCLGLSSGIGILISQYFGAKEDEKLKKVIANSIYVMGAVGILMSVVSVTLAKPILKLMNTPAENFDYAYTYMVIVCAGTVVVAAYNVVSAILRALGDSKTPLFFLIIASLVNVVLDLLFILKFHMGVAGAAWATVISQAIAAIGSVIFACCKNPYFHLQKKDFSPDKCIIQKSFQIGLPLAGQTAMISISCTLLQSVVNGYGSTIMAAYTATNRVEQFVQQPFNSLGLAMSTFAGQNAGALEYRRVKTGVKKATILVALFSLVMVFVMFLFGRQIVGIFLTDPDIIDIGAKGLCITSLMYFALGVIYVTRGALNGVGDAAYAMINGLCEVAGRILFAYLLTMIPVIGFWGIWYTNGFTWVITGIAGTIRFIKGRWERKLRGAA